MNKTIKFLTTLLLLAVSVGAWAEDKWVKTSITDLATNDIVVIVDETSSMAMSNDNGTSAAPTATSVTLSADKSEITSTVVAKLQWEVEVLTNTYRFAIFNETNHFYNCLYCTKTNNGVRVGINSNNQFSWDSSTNKLKNTATNRWIGVYDNQDWRCYTSSDGNIVNTKTVFYKLVSESSSSAVATTTNIDDSGITNTDVYAGATAGSLSATVSAGGNAISGASVSWSSSNTDVATIDENGAVTLVSAGTATITASYAGVADQYQASSDTYELTVTSSAPIIDYAELPFEWAGGASADFLALNGVIANGLGSDYASNHAPYLIKLDGTGDYIQVKTDSQPGKVTIGVKMIGGNTPSTITVQGSADGETFTDVQELTISGAQNAELTLETTNSFAATDRYVRLLFTKGANVGVGPITIDMPSTDPVINASDINLSYGSASGNIQYTIDNPVDGGVLSASTNSDWLTVSNESGNWMYNATENTTAAERTATVTLTYTYNTNQQATKDITVTQAGNPNHPYTVAEAIAATPSTGNVCIHGIVSSFYNTSIVGDGNYYRYYISDDGSTGTQLLVFKGKDINQNAFDDENDLLVGDEVIIYGKLITYNNAPEVAADNYIVSQFRKELNYITLSGNYPTTFVEGREFSHEGIVVTAHYNDDSTKDVTEYATFSEPDMTQIGEQTVTVSFNGKSTNYTITITEAPSHTATFSVNGEIISTATVTVKEGVAITFPTEVEAPEGYTFTGWVAAPIAGTQATAPEYVTSATMGESDVTFYAVLAKVTPGTAITTTDVLDRATTGVTGTSYTDWSGKTVTSDAVYAGNSAGDKESIQLRSKNSNSGIVTTTSGGNAKKVTVVWNDNTASGRTLDIYGKNSAYTDATDLYDSSKQGTKLGSIVYGTSTELTITGDYPFIGLRSKDGAMYLTSISIDWQTGTPDTYSNFCTTIPVPTISIADIELGCEAQDGTVALSYENFDISETEFDIQYYEDAEGNVGRDKPEWINDIYVEEEQDGNYVVSYNIKANNGEARTAYFKVIAEGYVWSNLVTITQAAATVPVSISAAGMATLSNENALDFTNVRTIEAYYATLDDSGNVAYHRIRKVPAETGLLIRNAAGEAQGAVSDNVPTLTGTAESVEGNILVAALEAITGLQSESDGYKNYLLNKHSQYGLGFYLANGKNLAANRAYMRIPVQTAREFIGINFDGDATGIESIRLNGADDAIYDLQGRKVMNPAKGLYIVNGKKVVVK